jgi:hypothetical protein
VSYRRQENGPMRAATRRPLTGYGTQRNDDANGVGGALWLGYIGLASLDACPASLRANVA